MSSGDAAAVAGRTVAAEGGFVAVLDAANEETAAAAVGDDTLQLDLKAAGSLVLRRRIQCHSKSLWLLLPLPLRPEGRTEGGCWIAKCGRGRIGKKVDCKFVVTVVGEPGQVAAVVYDQLVGRWAVVEVVAVVADKG